MGENEAKRSKSVSSVRSPYLPPATGGYVACTRAAREQLAAKPGGLRSERDVGIWWCIRAIRVPLSLSSVICMIRTEERVDCCLCLYYSPTALIS